MAKRAKYQTVRINVPSGTATSTTITAKDFLDSNYSRCTALAVVKGSGADAVAIGIRSQNDQVIDAVHSKLLEVQQDTPVQGRFIPVNIPAGGKEVTIQAQPLYAATAADNRYEIIFKLEE